MGGIVDDELCGKRRPVVGVKNATAEKRHKPRPVSVRVIVGADVKAEPAASVFHVLLEIVALHLRFGKIIEPDDQADIFELCGIHIIPVGCGRKDEMLFLSEAGKKREGLIGKSDVVRLAAIGVEGDDANGRLLRIG